MESQPQNPEFRIHPESFHPCDHIPNQSWAILILNLLIFFFFFFLPQHFALQ